ncbi:MAG: DUF3189 family protein [Bacteroidota bacterium]
MKIIYHCCHGGCAASVAAAVHLGMLPESGRPRGQDILSAPYFGHLDRHDLGFLFPCGQAGGADEVFVAGWSCDASIMVNAAQAAVRLAGADPGGFVTIDCSHAYNRCLYLLAHVVRFLCGARARRRFLAQTMLRRYPRLVRAAQAGRDRISS